NSDQYNSHQRKTNSNPVFWALDHGYLHNSSSSSSSSISISISSISISISSSSRRSVFQLSCHLG
ncbi:hypothetical protein STEG23_004697, partial [Scotinomys teguina]